MTLKNVFKNKVVRLAASPSSRIKSFALAVLLASGFFAAQADAAHMVPVNLRARYDSVVEQAALRNHIDSNLLRAVITAESGYNRHVVSSAGAVGLMQLLPATAHRFGARNVHDPVQNIHAGARYISYLMGMFKNNMRLAIAAYNAGEGSVIKSGYRVPAFAQTRAYVPRVLALYAGYREIY